jgi:xanthine dehydrogenase large subunit
MNRITDAPFAAATADAPAAVVGRDHAHESAALHVAGSATYIDDLPELAGTLHCALGLSPLAHGRLKGIALDKLRALPGVVDVICAEHIPGENQCGPIVHDDPILAPVAGGDGASLGIVQYLGQPVFAVIADTRDAPRPAPGSSWTSNRCRRC